jgi:dihydrodiol dehydrogenase / D-xylose 1-dehydrogenase (NADP)
MDESFKSMLIGGERLMEHVINWGILGTGTIAGRFAEGLSYARGAQLLAVGSRAENSAQTFSTLYDVPRYYGAYEGLVQDPDVDVVYISSPHAFHYEHTLLALRAGKAVLCEKPITINAAEASELVRESRERGLFLMEAMWTRFFPLMRELGKLLAEQVIGDLHNLIANFGIRSSIEMSERLFRLELGGGALLDLGVYLVSLASLLFGEPDRIVSMVDLGESGVDEQASIILGFPTRAQASLYTAIHTETPKEAIILGSKGRIHIHPNFHRPTQLALKVYDDPDRLIKKPIVGNGMNYEADEVMQCLRAGLTESPTMPLDESVSIMRTLDKIRDPWNLRYPADSRNKEWNQGIKP